MLEATKPKPTNIHFSSHTDSWETPKYLFDHYNDIYSFTLDVSASLENAKCEKYFTQMDNGLKQKWTGSCWMNPPYGRQIGKWIKKAYLSALDGATVVCLLPARTDTKWSHDYCMKGKIEFIRGRVKFGNAKHNAPFPSLVVVFDQQRIGKEMTNNIDYLPGLQFN